MRVLQVSEFIEIVNGILRETLSGEVFAVEGEISGYRVNQGQWVTFDLKDEKSLLNIFMPLWSLNVPLEDGMRVKVFGLPRIYPKYGKFSITAERVELSGEGALKKALAALRLKLEKEGMFDQARKRSLPRFPRRIALIASRESAAFGDFIKILGERWGGLEIDSYHVLVQGQRAPQDIVKAIEEANSHSSKQGESSYYDVLVMTRGGGSLEELMAFNDERVVRAIFGSKIPTLVAIGHERDLTFAEEAADVRGSTPTDCARRLVPDKRDVLYELAMALEKIEGSMATSLEEKQAILERAFAAPGVWLMGRTVELDGMSMRVVTAVDSWLLQLHQNLSDKLRLLQSLDPRAVLRRGYAMVKDMAGKAVTSAKTLHFGDAVTLVLQDGEVGATIDGRGDKFQTKLL
ncbi:MAG: exodeoxyribonuclease VII large subunit [Patescibacteria group bacterium]|nr:exodeoxyribonuclease VII large subunit [Patescibacteria group bacterium]